MRLIARSLVVFLILFLVACGGGSSSSGGGSVEVTKIVAIGDSIGTNEFASSPWPNLIAGATGAKLFNNSIGGSTTLDHVGSVGAILDREQPSHMVILLGANDALAGRDPASSAANIQSMIDQGTQRGVIVIVGTTLAILNTPNANAITADLANRIHGLSGANIADTRAAVGSNPANYANFVHPNQSGQGLIASAMLRQF